MDKKPRHISLNRLGFQTFPAMLVCQVCLAIEDKLPGNVKKTPAELGSDIMFACSRHQT